MQRLRPRSHAASAAAGRNGRDPFGLCRVACAVALPAAAQDTSDWPAGGTYVGYGSGFGAMLSAEAGVNAGVEFTGGQA